MIDSLLAKLAPHHCCGCGKIGTILCDSCKNDILEQPFSACFECNQPTPAGEACQRCSLPYSRVWCAGPRVNTLLTVINAYKYERVRAAYRALGGLLADTMPVLPSDAVIVPMPTVAFHIRQRGYDHAHLLAKEVARHKTLRFVPKLERISRDVQLGAKKAQRVRQAKQAFRAVDSASDELCIVIDDIATTGASVRYAAQALRDAGARDVWIAVVAKQPLD